MQETDGESSFSKLQFFFQTQLYDVIWRFPEMGYPKMDGL